MSPLRPHPNLHVINLFGGPGAGKSTAALGLAYELKKRWASVELITEYAKELVWTDSAHLLSNQNYVFSQQEHRLNRLVNKVEIAITDSPLLLSAFYAPPEYPVSFKQSVFDFFQSYQNINIFVERSHKYAEEGRLQNQEEADALSESMKRFLADNGIPYYSVTANDANPIYLCYWLAKSGLVTFPDTVRPFGQDDVPPPGWIQPSLNQALDDQGLPVAIAAAVGRRYVPDGVRTKADTPAERS